MRSSRLGVCVRLFLLLAVLAPARAAANDLARAKALYEEGQTAFAASRYADAAALFEQAFASGKQPALLWNVAASHRRQFDVDGDITRLKRARQVYLNYSELVDAAEQKEEARQEIRAIEARIEEAAKTAPAPVPVVAAVPVADPPGRSGLVAGVVLVAAGVALGGAALGTGLASQSSYDQLAGQCGANRDRCPDGFQGTRDVGRGLEVATWVLASVGVAAVAAGVAVLVARVRRPAEGVTLGPAWLPGGGAIALMGRW